VAQVVEHLLSKSEALSFSNTKKKKEDTGSRVKSGALGFGSKVWNGLGVQLLICIGSEVCG
jgi:hypothetical protein